MAHPVVEAVRDYENFLECGSDDHELLGSLVARLDDLNAWNFESTIRQVLGKLNIHHLNEPMYRLSGGQRKRVALAQALVEAQLHAGHLPADPRRTYQPPSTFP